MLTSNSIKVALCWLMLCCISGGSPTAAAQSLDAIEDAKGQALIETFDAIYTEDLDRARQTLDSARQRAQATGDVSLLLAYLDRVLTRFRYAGDLEPIIDDLEAFEAAQQDQLTPAQALFLELGIIALQIQAQNDLMRAEARLLALTADPAGRPFEATIQRTLGDLYQTLGQYPRAIEYYTNALRLDQSPTFRANVYNNLGNTTGYLEDWEQSSAHYLEAIELYDRLNQRTDVLLVQANLGATYRAAGQLEEALAVYRAGLASLQPTDSPDLEAQFQMNLGNLYIDLNQIDAGLAALNRSLTVCSDEGFDYCVMLNHLNIGHAHYVAGDFAQALRFYDMTAADLESIDDPYIERQLMDNYADLYRDQGNYQLALTYSDRYQALDRQLISAEAKASAEEIQTRYETELKDAELAIQAEQIERQRAQIQFGVVLTIGVVSLLAVAVFFLSFRARTLQSLYERNQDLLRQNEVNQRLTHRHPQPGTQPDQESSSKDGATPSLEKVFERITDALQQDTIYRDANLSLGDLASHVASNSTYVSNAISQFANTNFNNLVNYYRIMDARRQLNQPTPPSIAQLAAACGFNSKASFYRAFSKYVGMSPSQYLDRLKANQTDSATP